MTIRHTRLRTALFASAIALLFAGPLRAAITTTGDVSPDPGTTTGYDDLYVGDTADGTLLVDGRSHVGAHAVSVGREAGVTGAVTIDATGWVEIFDSLVVGESGAGELTITGGRADCSREAFLGLSEGSVGAVSVVGTGSTWGVAWWLNIGNEGTGTLDISGGGRVETGSASVGALSGSSGTVTVDGSGSTWFVGGLVAGDEGTGSLDITGGGAVNAGYPFVVGKNGHGGRDGRRRWFDIVNVVYRRRADRLRRRRLR